MACIFCGERDPSKLTMSTRVMQGKVVSVDVCFSCRWREREQAEVIRMEDEGILHSEEGIFSKHDFCKPIGRFNRLGTRKLI